MKSLPKITFALYLFILLWLVLFKFSADPVSVLLHYQTRSLNVVPFAGWHGSLREMIDNVSAFVPFGLLLSANFKALRFWRKLGIVFACSVAVETLQFVLAIGRTDITDVITNTLGGLLGLALYGVARKGVSEPKLDQFLAVLGIVLAALLLYARFFVFRVRY